MAYFRPGALVLVSQATGTGHANDMLSVLESVLQHAREHGARSQALAQEYSQRMQLEALAVCCNLAATAARSSTLRLSCSDVLAAGCCATTDDDALAGSAFSRRLGALLQSSMTRVMHALVADTYQDAGVIAEGAGGRERDEARRRWRKMMAEMLIRSVIAVRNAALHRPLALILMSTGVAPLLASFVSSPETLPAPHLCAGGDLKASPRGFQDSTRPLRGVLPVDAMRRLTEMAMGALFNLSGHALSPALVASLAPSAQEAVTDAEAESVRQTTVGAVVQQSSTLAAVYRVLPCVIDVKELVSRQSRYGRCNVP